MCQRSPWRGGCTSPFRCIPGLGGGGRWTALPLIPDDPALTWTTARATGRGDRARTLSSRRWPYPGRRGAVEPDVLRTGGRSAGHGAADDAVCVGLHCAWVARGGRWPVAPKSNAGEPAAPRQASSDVPSDLRFRSRQDWWWWWTQSHPIPSPPCVTFRRVVAPLWGPGQSPGLPFACCVGSLLSVGRCGRCSCWCRFRVRGAQWLVCRGCAECGGMCRLRVSGAQ